MLSSSKNMGIYCGNLEMSGKQKPLPINLRRAAYIGPYLPANPCQFGHRLICTVTLTLWSHRLHFYPSARTPRIYIIRDLPNLSSGRRLQESSKLTVPTPSTFLLLRVLKTSSACIGTM